MTPKLRQSFYFLSSGVLALLGLAQLWGAVKTGTLENVDQILTGLGTLLGSGAPAVAGSKVKAQREDGTFDPTSITDIVQASVDARAKIDADLKQVTDLIGSTPVLGPLATQAINSLRF